MTRTLPVLLLVCATLFFTSCKKELSAPKIPNGKMTMGKASLNPPPPPAPTTKMILKG